MFIFKNGQFNSIHINFFVSFGNINTINSDDFHSQSPRLMICLGRFTFCCDAQALRNLEESSFK